MAQNRAFSMADPDAYRAAVRAAEVDLFVTRRGAFEAEIIQVELDRLWLQRSRDSLPRVIRAAMDTQKRAPILFLPDPALGPILHGGVALNPGELVVYGQSAIHHHRSDGPSKWATLSLTPEAFAEAGCAIAGREIEVPHDTYIFRPEAKAMARLNLLHDNVDQLVRTSPELLLQPQVARALERDLLHAMVACLTRHLPPTNRSCAGSHARIILRFEEFLVERRYEPLYLADICTAIGVPERTLRSCCQEHVGMGPIRYLWLRRMHLAHRALLLAEPGSTSVTDVATHHGFWELGRFSVEYRSLFGKTPSAARSAAPPARSPPVPLTRAPAEMA
ncbi:MAG: helix-turn-helix domain-containing protein [Reyranellaceae bacterium]